MSGLRLWAAGYAADEAAVELLVAVARVVPAVLDPSPVCWSPWLRRCPRPDVWCLDGVALADAAEGFPLPVRPVVTAAGALATDGALVELGVTLAGVPAEWLGPVFAALAHAAGCPGLRLVATDGHEPGLFPWLDESSPVTPALVLPAGPRRAALAVSAGAA